MGEFLKKIPVLGALAGDGIKSTEGVGFGAIIAWATVGDLTTAKAIAVTGLAIGLGIYAYARGQVKAVAAKEAA